MNMKKNVYCVGNAHLDPIWMWKWQEGSAEAKATVRSALDRMNEFPDFKFVCSSSVVYRWIEEFDPAMFEEIKLRVAEGRFVIVGGWVVQPDCNNPSGEAFARHGLYGQRYFMEKFGTCARVGYNVDSFGHNAMLPQILKKSGMDAYVFMRPMEHEKHLENDLFRWIAPDGSEVDTIRLHGCYCNQFNDEEQLAALMRDNNDQCKTDVDVFPLFYGVGNHGGGPTVRHIELLKAWASAHPEQNIVFSDLSDFFEKCHELKKEFPIYQGDLQHHASGCYAAVSAVKDTIRKAENALYAAEAYSVMGYQLLSRRYPAEDIRHAWENVCFMHFHDSMGGCSTHDAHEGVLLMGNEARSVAARLENNALQSLSWAIDTHDVAGFPVIVFNPHPWSVTETVQINKQIAGMMSENGEAIPVQHVYSQTETCYGRHDTIFCATVPAMGWATYLMSEVADEVSEASESNVRACEDTLENEHYRVKFEMYTGHIAEIYDKDQGKNILAGKAAVPVVIDEYKHDTWSHARNFFTEEIGIFTDATVKVIENGPVRATVKVVNRYGGSTLTQYFSLTAGEDILRVRARIDWHEKHKMLKLAYPMALHETKAIYEIPFGYIERPDDGEEEPALMWMGVQGTEGAYALINNNKYSFSVKGSTMYLTAVRSPLYGDHGRPRSDEALYTDQGVSEFNYALTALNTSAMYDVVRVARQFNMPLVNIMENRHNGHLPHTYRGLTVDARNIAVTALKRAEDGQGLVIRAYETDGKAVDATLTGGLLRTPLTAHFTPHEIKTLYLPDDRDEWREVMIPEWDV